MPRLSGTILLAVLTDALLGGATHAVEVAGNDDLAHVVILVGEETTVVAAGQSLSVFQGQSLKIIDAFLKSGGRPAIVNLVGFVNPIHGGADDRNVWVDSGRAMLKSWSINGEGRRYRIRASSQGRIHGNIYVNILPPKLSYVEVSINGQKRLLRENESLSLKASDQFKIDKVVASPDQLQKLLKYRIMEDQPGSASRYKVELLQNEQVFSSFNLHVEAQAPLLKGMNPN